MPKSKPKRTYEKRLYINMDFAEALERFGATDPAELPERIKLSQKRKTAGNKPTAKTREKGHRNRTRQPQ